jgi:hypothetical protein
MTHFMMNNFVIVCIIFTLFKNISAYKSNNFTLRKILGHRGGNSSESYTGSDNTSTVTSKTEITISADQSYNADYYCTVLSDIPCHIAIQKAICDLKGLEVGEFCGLSVSTANNPDFNLNYESNGGTVKFLSGTFVLNQNFVIYSNIILDGRGIDQTILKLVDDAESFYRVPDDCDGGRAGFIRSTIPSKNMIIRQMTLDGNRKNQRCEYSCPYDPDQDKYEYGRYGLFMEAITDSLVEYVKIKSFQGYGFDPHGIGGTFEFTERLTITNCVSEDNGWDGFTLDKLKNSIFTHNIAVDNGRHGINIVTGTRKTVISQNQVIGNGHFYFDKYGNAGAGCGITVQNNQAYRTSEILITDNFIEESKKEGICINNGHAISVINNHIYKADKCISISDQSSNGQGTKNSIFSNNICDNSNGIKIKKNSVNNIISNNMVIVKFKSSSVGIQIENSLFTLNQIKNNLFVNTQNNYEFITTILQDPEKVVYTLVSDREFNVKKIEAGKDTMKTFNAGDLETLDVSVLVNTANNHILSDSSVLMIIELTNVKYYPTIFEYSDSSSDRFGIRFDIPFPETLEWEVPQWKVGLNMIKYELNTTDFFEKTTATFDWTNIERLQISRSLPQEESLNDIINFELIQIGRTSGFI